MQFIDASTITVDWKHQIVMADNARNYTVCHEKRGSRYLDCNSGYSLSIFVIFISL